MRIRKGAIISLAAALLSAVASLAMALYFTGSDDLPWAEKILASSALFIIAGASLALGTLLMRKEGRFLRLSEWLKDSHENILLSPTPPAYKGKDEISRAAEWVEKILCSGREKFLRYIEVLETMPVAVLELDRGFRVVFSNRKATDLTGYSREELHGKPFYELLGGESLPVFKKLPLKGENPVTGLELQIRTREGRVSNAELCMTAVREGGKVIGAVIALRDIDEVKKTRDELSEARRSAEETSEKLRDNIKELEEFALMAVKRELKMKEIRESLRRLMEEAVRH